MSCKCPGLQHKPYLLEHPSIELKEMQGVREKFSNMASSIRKRAKVSMAAIQEKSELAIARTHDEKKMVRERRKAREAEANMQLHQAKANHKAQKLNARHARLMGSQVQDAPVKATNTKGR